MNVDLKQDNQKSGLGLFFRILMLLATPVAMILLAYLFLIPPETQPEHEVTSIGLVILDPVPMEPLSELDDDNSTLGRWFHQGLAGPLEPLGADTMDDAVIEITTGFNPRKLPLGHVTLNLETYELIERSSINQGSPAVDAILTNAGYTA